MRLPEPDEFADRYDDEELLAEFPDRPVTSLRDIQYVYGKLYTLATVGGGEYAPYLTPDQATDLLDEGDSLIVVRVDLSGDKTRLDPGEPVQVKKYKRDLVEKVAHSYYDSARGFDHSVTHRSGRDKKPEKLAEYAQNRLTRWAADDVIQSTAKEHDDGWIIEALAELGEDDESLDVIEQEVTRQIDGTATSLLTVQVKLDEDGDYLYPGDVELFNETMKRRLLSKLVSKGEATDSKGEAVDMVSADEGTTVGTSEDPLNYYLGKQMEKFPGFDPDEAWRTHPVSEDSALSVNKAEPFVSACTYTTFGATVYYLPYFIGEPEPETLRELYGVLYGVVDEGDMTPVEVTYEEYNRDKDRVPGRLRFYVTAVMKHQQKRFDVYGETMDGRIHYPVDLSDAHRGILGTWAFDGSEIDGGVSAAFGVPPEGDAGENSWQLLRKETDFIATVATGWYFRNTFPSSGDDQDASADDARIQALVSVLSGDGIEVGELLKLYADRLTGESSDSFPQFTVASQYAQLCALAEAGLLSSKKEDREPITQPPQYEEGYTTMTRETPVTDGGKAAARERKLAQFLEQTPALDDTENDGAERRGAFLLGALVGELTGLQKSEDRGTTFIDQYPVKSMTKPKLKRTVEEALNKDIVYSRERDQGSTMYSEVVDRLRDTLLKHDREVDDWKIRNEDLRFYYSLGVTYGMNSYVSVEDEES